MNEWLPFSDFTKRLPQHGYSAVSSRTLHRYSREGFNIHGQRVRLQTVILHGRRCTSIDAWQKFIDQQIQLQTEETV